MLARTNSTIDLATQQFTITAMTALRAKRPEEAQSSLDMLEAALDRAHAESQSRSAATHPGSNETAPARSTKAEEPRDPHEFDADRWDRLSLKTLLRRGIVAVAGVSEDLSLSAVSFWIARPVVGLVLICLFAVGGLYSLYIQNGDTFGAAPIKDYLALIVWGLSANVTSRSLGGLTKPVAPSM